MTVFDKTSVPPYQRIAIMVAEPKNSLIGDAKCLSMKNTCH